MFKLPNLMFLGSSQSTPKQKMSGIAGYIFSWKVIGFILFAILLAKWVWVFFAPVSPAVPTTTGWKKTDGANQLFGSVNTTGVSNVQASSSVSDIRLIGVFAHKTKGFAVMEVDNKQIGVAIGEQVMPGVRLLETHSSYVMVDRGGKQQRIDLVAANVASNTPTSHPAPKALSQNSGGQLTAGASVIPERTIDIEAATAAMEKLPPDQRTALRRQLGMIRGKN